MLKEDLQNRFTYHPPQPGQPERYESIRSYACEFAHLIAVLCPDSRERALAFTQIETAVFWANAAIARHPGGAIPINIKINGTPHRLTGPDAIDLTCERVLQLAGDTDMKIPRTVTWTCGKDSGFISFGTAIAPREGMHIEAPVTNRARESTIVIINGECVLVDNTPLTYDRIVELAKSGRPKEALHSITWRTKAGAGIIAPGESVLAEEDMVINAVVTDNS